MPLILAKHRVAQRSFLRDVRPLGERMADFWSDMDVVGATTVGLAVTFAMFSEYAGYADLTLAFLYFYFKWAYKKPFELPFKIPRFAGISDPHNPAPGKGGSGKAEGILLIGNLKDAGDPRRGQELWLTNTDARTHILYLGTTGSGKTEGLKSMVANALAWGSGFVYVDGKADTDLWASLYSLARRFGRDDDLLVLNYMTANSDDGAVSNTMNPFSNGSASYLSNMVTSLMPDAGGDNAMWKERAVALLSALMPALTWKRDKQGLLLDVGVLREYIELRPIIALSRDQNLPERIVRGLQGYLNTLPGYVDAAFDDEGNERPPSPDQPMYDLQVARQQHGYLSMQFTRSLQSLGDEYGYIFKAQLADVDVLDVVLQRRILIALIPALEKSGDEAANLGKIVAASLKGMMGATLGNTVEGSWEMAIGSKQTRSSSSFMTVFDEVGYYTAQGMAVMAAQARSLGFSLVFAAQDLPSMEKRVKQEAQSILANCNLKIFGKLEDPTETKEFLDKHAGGGYVMEARGYTADAQGVSSMFFSGPSYVDDKAAGGPTVRSRISYDHLRGQREGEAHLFFGEWLVGARMFYCKPERVKALRVHKLLPVPGSTSASAARERAMTEMAARLKDPDWSAAKATAATSSSPDLSALIKGLSMAANASERDAKASAIALINLTTLPSTAAAAAVSQDPFAEAPVKTKKSATEEASGYQSSTSQQMQVPPVSTTISAPFSFVTEQQEDAVAKVVPPDPELISSHAATRAHLPPLHEGDQFAITELDEFFKQAGVSDEVKEASAAMPRDIDIHNVAPPTGAMASDALATELSEEVAALLQESAEKLNQGLSGEARDK